MVKVKSKVKQSLNRIIVIGGSAGSLNAIKQILSGFKRAEGTAIFIVIHLSSSSKGNYIVDALQHYTSFECKLAEDGEKILSDKIYVAPPNVHTVISGNKIILGMGPPENRWRPSIDVLFRSAGVHYNGSSIGIILTGMLNDGTAGMQAISLCGGKCIVQDPEEAEYPDMPLSVLNHVKGEVLILPLEEIAQTSQQLKLSNGKSKIPDYLKLEAEISAKAVTDPNTINKLGERVPISCPDCGGTLFSIDNANESDLRYRCFIGHSYDAKNLLQIQNDTLEETLWTAIRMMEDNRMLIMTLSEKNKSKRHANNVYLQRIKNLENHIAGLKSLLLSVKKAV